MYKQNHKEETFVQPVLTMKGDGNMQIVPGDVIKPVVEEATTEERLMELFGKRYQTAFVLDAEFEQPESSLNKSINEALEIPLLKDAVVYLVAKYTEHIGHDRYVIFTEKELRERRFYSDKVALIQVYLKAVKTKQNRVGTEVAVQRMLTMRKLTTVVSYLVNDLEKAMLDKGLIERIIITPYTEKIINGRKTRIPPVNGYGLTGLGEAFLEAITYVNTHDKKVLLSNEFSIYSFQMK